MSRIVVVGGVAAGMSAASQAKRRSPEAEVVVFERGRHVSYGACGMPYNIEQPDRPIEDLVVFTPERLLAERGIEVRILHEVLGIDAARKVLTVKALETGEVREERWDRLVLATGASAARPPIPGIELPGIFFLRTLEDGDLVKRHLAGSQSKRAVIVGGGYIGLEMTEILRSRGLEVVVLERLEQLAPGLEPEIVAAIRAELDRHGVRVETGVGIERLAAEGEGIAVHTDRGVFEADLVLVSTGVRPNVELARGAGARIGPTGAIAVDAGMRTDVPDLFAAGDCAEAEHLVSGRPAWVPLGTTANKQGKVAGANAAGADERFGGIVGSSAFKVFDLEVARTGLGAAEIAGLGLDAVRAPSAHHSRARGDRGSRELRTVLFAERASGRLLGAQMVGADTVAKRVDVFAAALYARLTVGQIEDLDLTYAPPIAPVYDPILIAAAVASKRLAKAEGG